MSGTYNLEGDQPPTIVGPPVSQEPAGGAPPAQAQPPAEPPAEPPAPEPEPEGTIVDAAGRKMVPLESLIATRTELKAAKQLAAGIEQLREAAARGEQAAQVLDTLQPLIQRLRSRPDIVAAVMGQAGMMPAQPHGPPQGYQYPPGYQPPYPQQDPGEAIMPKHEAEDLARTLELYTPQGVPDIDRARKLAIMMRRTSRDEALAAQAPIAQTVAGNQAGTLKQQYAQVRDKHGRMVNQAVLDQLFAIVPPELVARDPQVAGVLYYAAKGYAAHHGLDEPTAPPRPPLVSEPAGGRPPAGGAGPLTEFDRAIQRTMQVSDKQYQETAARYQPGRINILE